MKKIIFTIITAVSLSACSSITVNGLTYNERKPCWDLYDNNRVEAKKLIKDITSKYDESHIYKRKNLKIVKNDNKQCEYKYSFVYYDSPIDLKEVSFEFYISK